MRARDCIRAALAILMTLGAPAISVAAPSAEPAKAQAQALLRQGNSLLEHGYPSEALQKFVDAYRLFPSPKLHYNMGQAHSLIPGHEAQAYDEMSRFLTDVPDANAELRAAAEALCQRLRPTVVPAPPPSAAPMATAPAPPPVLDLQAPLGPIEEKRLPLPANDREPHWTGRQKIGLGLVALGAASLLFGVVEHVRYFGKADDFRNAGCGTNDLSAGANCRSLNDQFNSAQLGWIIGYLGAAALGGTGAFLFWIAPPEPARATESGVNLSMNPGVTLHLQARF